MLFCDGYAKLFFCFIRYSYYYYYYSRENVFRKRKSGQLQRKVEKFGQTA
jgi:hypothetical protein